MTWNWQKSDWPHFRYDAKALKALEDQFLYEAGQMLGVERFVDDADRQKFMVDWLSTEAVKTSEIEGEILRRDSVQSSIRQKFGLSSTSNATPKEQGMVNLMLDLYQNYKGYLSHTTLHDWHQMIMQGETKLQDVVGAYRRHEDPMQVVSGPLHQLKVHFEAPPSSDMRRQMNYFLKWYQKDLPALTHAGLVHLYFVCIHPFEDGNGRIARALCEKSLAQHLNRPSLIALSEQIENDRKQYYRMLERNNKELEVTEWLVYFANTVLKALNKSKTELEFIVTKTKFLNKHKHNLNNRQLKVILRIFEEGPQGFSGGLSASHYISITKTSRATATRDLQDLVDQGIFKQEGELKGTRYYIRIDM